MGPLDGQQADGALWVKTQSSHSNTMSGFVAEGEMQIRL